MALVETKQSRVSQCRVRDFWISLDLSSVRGIERADQVAPVVDQWPQVGSLPTRTSDIPVFSLAGLLGFSETGEQHGSQLLLLDTPSGPVGVLVNQSSQGTIVTSASFLRMPAVVQSQHFPAVVRIDSDIIPWLDLDSIFTGRSSRELPQSNPWPHRISATSRDRLMVIPLPAAIEAERAWGIGLPAALVAELVESRQFKPVPGTPAFVTGVMPWRDQVIGVLDLCAWLGLQPLEAGKSLVAVVASPGSAEPIGLLIPRGVRILKLPIPNLASERAFPGDPEQIVMPVEVGDQTIALIDLARLSPETAQSSGPERNLSSVSPQTEPDPAMGRSDLLFTQRRGATR
ncbi:MAG: chemotaxis protein CheW [Planctomycetes bacterium]|nr:chemotaxis protein CheW [Planctomycetota bacterium]